MRQGGGALARLVEVGEEGGERLDGSRSRDHLPSLRRVDRQLAQRIRRMCCDFLQTG